VSAFLENARSLFEAAENVLASGEAPSEMSILVGVEGGIRMIANSDWPLDRLRAHHGAEMAYRVTGSTGRVAVEGRAARSSCHFETADPQAAAKMFLRDMPAYRI
jgi:hypothetical protein